MLVHLRKLGKIGFFFIFKSNPHPTPLEILENANYPAASIIEPQINEFSVLDKKNNYLRQSSSTEQP